MAYELTFPDVGEGITEGELVKWRVKKGDTIKEDDIIAEVETDKAVVEIPTPKSGTVTELKFKEGDTIKVGQTLLTLNGTPAPQKILQKKPEPQKDAGAVVGFLEEPPEESLEKSEEIKQSATRRADESVQHILAMPKVRQLAKELGVDLATVQPSGTQGNILESDVRKVTGVGASQVQKKVEVIRKYDMYGYVDRIPLKGVRKATSQKMTESWTTIPHVTQTERVDVTELVTLREKEKKIAAQKNIKLTFLPFVYKAVIEALRAYPAFNASLEGEEIILKKYYNIGFAVDTPDGLLVPVIKGADKKSVLHIAQEIQEKAQLARERKLNLMDMKGGTFTITNYGSIGGIYGTPIINYPESAILGMGRIQDEPLVKDGKIVIRKIMHLTLSFDHRITDGAQAAQFMNTIKSYLEDPDLFILDM